MMIYPMYFSKDYIWFLLAIGIVAIISAIASSKVKSTFKKYDRIFSRSGKSGAQVASELLRFGGAAHVSVGRVAGELTDHYHPAKEIVNLSSATYDSRSIAAAAVAAHEIGHVMQKHKGYFLYNARSALVPIVNFGSRLAMPLVLIGLLLDSFVRLANPDTGFYIAMIGVILYGSSLLFSLVTLPVELDASRRAIRMLLDNHVISSDEAPAARKVLSAAAFTYLVSVLASLVYFLRFLFYVLSIFGRRNSK